MRQVLIALVVLAAVVRPPAAPAQTVAEARAFMNRAEKQLLELSTEEQRGEWVQSTYITYDTEILSALGNQRLIALTTRLARESTRFDKLALPPELARKMKLLKLQLTLATPSNQAESAEATKLESRMEAMYASGKYCRGGKCLDLDQITNIMRTSRDPAELLDVWKGWRTVSPTMRPLYERFVALSNKGARELGFADTGAMWRSKYDMSPDAFSKELDRLWDQVRPLYLSLHAYVRNRLREKYGDSVVPAHGPIPAHLLGNPWAQTWDNIYDLVAPPGTGAAYDLTKILVDRKTDARGMVRYGEGFFRSLGFAPLPETFWERSLFVRPRDREVVCHASAWDVDSKDDLRLKMCIEINAEDFTTIHHELGHNIYQRAYNNQPYLFRDSANDGFHEAIGDTIALSITPEYLVKLGFLDQPTPESGDIGLLMKRALEKVAFLPFGLMIDQWRWKVFSGEIKPADYNRAWWALRLKYQGIAPPVSRNESEFDPGAKYHVAANVPYTRYFLADILQFQFHRALAKVAGCSDPLYRCSIYGNQAAGERLNGMLQMGLSRPWPEALYALTGERRMDATAILDYFAPLKRWLDEQNRGKPAGW